MNIKRSGKRLDLRDTNKQDNADNCIMWGFTVCAVELKLLKRLFSNPAVWACG
jgi:hypothetical protein